MMRFILYDCQRTLVPLEKDIEFLENYLEMEKQRYPAADIQFSISVDGSGRQIAPLLFIQFFENSFKHGAHRLNDSGFIHGSLRLESNILLNCVMMYLLSPHRPLLHAMAEWVSKMSESAWRCIIPISIRWPSVNRTMFSK